MIAKNPKRDFSLFSETDIVKVLYCFESKNLVYASIAGIIRESDFYDIAVKIPATIVINQLIFNWLFAESDSSYDNLVCDIASNKQFGARDFCDMNQNGMIDFTKRYNKNEVTLYCRKCDPYFVC